ncbi:hypothetical protein COF51_30950, partial [Bacillus pseudomycoides]
HQVEHRAEQPLAAVQPAQIAAQPFVAVALVGADVAQAGGGLPGQLSQAAGRVQPQAERRDVHRHAGHAQRG